MKKAKKQSNIEWSTNHLTEQEIKFVSRNRGHHLMIEKDGKVVFDFWPSTGKYHNRATGQYRLGVRNLIKELNDE